ncbi:unnamed protein product [Trypanosoma congolense IL3000]|uniref:WGS project CAEQ00000000 data, annotated contig 835 n=1 Tax=Trypanosoma congolense (strain IL3000) TaxID=1068625 RepID=F9WIU2_TRYCI|nr:unnamed protein product [Trypanosoma congolense IL3000]
MTGSKVLTNATISFACLLLLFHPAGVAQEFNYFRIIAWGDDHLHLSLNSLFYKVYCHMPPRAVPFCVLFTSLEGLQRFASFACVRWPSVHQYDLSFQVVVGLGSICCIAPSHPMRTFNGKLWISVKTVQLPHEVVRIECGSYASKISHHGKYTDNLLGFSRKSLPTTPFCSGGPLPLRRSP